MNDKFKLDIDHNCWLDYGYGYISLNYKERSPDSWYSDIETDIHLDKEKCLQIIEFLHNAIQAKEEHDKDWEVSI